MIPLYNKCIKVQYLKYLLHASNLLLLLLASYKVILCNNLFLQEYIWTSCRIDASLQLSASLIIHCINHLIQDCRKKSTVLYWHTKMGILAQFGPCYPTISFSWLYYNYSIKFWMPVHKANWICPQLQELSEATIIHNLSLIKPV